MATSGEAINGTNTTKIITPKTLADVGATLPNISGKTEKTTLADNDLFLIEDSADSNAKKKVKLSNIVKDAVTDSAYGSGRATDTLHAPSRKSVYDKIESMAAESIASSDKIASVNIVAVP